MANSNNTKSDQYFVVDEDGLVIQDTVKAFYESINIDCPKKLLGREIQMYGNLIRDLKTLENVNQNLKDTCKFLTVQAEEKPVQDKSFERRKWVTSWTITILFISLISSFAQFSLDSDRKVLMRENQKLQQQSLVEQNEDLRAEIQVIKKQKVCWLF